MIVDHLQKTFAARTQKNPSYSLRSFARSMDIDSSTLSAILRRKRPLTLKTAQKLLSKLEINDPDRVRALLLDCFAEQAPLPAPDYRELDLAHAEMVSDWQHTALLEATGLTGFKSTAKNLAQRLNIPFAVARECLDRLVLLGLLREIDGVYKKSETNSCSPTNIPSEKIRQGHRQRMEKAIESLETVSVDRREISSTTLAVNSKRLEEAKQRIRRFRRELAAFLEEGPRDSVFTINIQLFPLDGTIL